MDLPGYYSPANFLDAEEFRPTAAIFDILGNGSTTPYSDGVGGIIQQHTNEIETSLAGTVIAPIAWKKRIREFLKQNNDNILQFLNSSGETLLRKFGKGSIREMVLDVSGTDCMAEINKELLSLRTDSGVNDYMANIKYILDEYRKSGENAMFCEAELKGHLEVLDKIHEKVSAIVDLEPYEPLLEATEKYIEILYKKHRIDDSYKKFIEAYRRFLALRNLVILTRTMESVEHEPLCMICLTDSVSFTLSPCGHTYCGTCIKKQAHSCFICRGTIRDRVKIFFG